jgi:hypothetical protein
MAASTFSVVALEDHTGFRAAGIVCAFLANWNVMQSKPGTSSRGSTPTQGGQLKKSRTESAGAVQVASAIPLAGGANARTRAAFRLVSSPF